MAASPPRLAPGPRGHWLLGNLSEFRRDVLGLMMRSAGAFGDVVRFRLGPPLGGRTLVHLLNHPAHAAYVLQKHASNFDKSTRSAAFIAAVTGESLLTSNGAFWQRQRRLLQPAFHRQNLATFAGQMIAATQAMLGRWRERAAPSEPLDVAAEMMRLTYTIVGRTLFRADVGAEADPIARAMPIILSHTFGRIGQVLNWPGWIPNARNRCFQRALRDVDRVVFRLIAEHRRAQNTEAAGADLLSLLLCVRDEETGAGLTDEQLRNETVTFLLAGHETTANALTWTFYLLAQHPDVARQLGEEIASVLGERAPTLEDVPRLPWTRMVIKEAMRLYPPIWIIERRVLADDAIEGFFLPAGSAVVVAPYALHRHPAFWEQPETFDPTRFAKGTPEAYIPFGAGPRSCIGSEFALLEAQLILALVMQSFSLRLVPGRPVEPLPGITLRTRGGLWMSVYEQ